MLLPWESDIQGWMSEKELIWLYKEAQNHRIIVEIGSWKGRSTKALASGCKGTVISIDTFEGSPSEINNVHKEALQVDIREIFKENMKSFENVLSLKLKSLVAAELFDQRSIDMIFIDGEHTEEAVINDVEAWVPKSRRMVYGHDCNMIGVKKALNRLKDKYQIEHITDSIWGIRSPNETIA